MRNQEMFDDLFERAVEMEEFGNTRVVACITDGKSNYAYGYNRRKTHPFQKLFGCNEESIYLHAEIDAIKNWLRFNGDTEDLGHCTLYVLRVKRNSRGGPFVAGLSKPCKGCARAIITFGIGKVYFTEDDADQFISL